MKIKKIILMMFISVSIFFAQSINITQTLQKIKQNKISEAKKDLIRFKKINANSPAVIYLDALLTENGTKAQKLYNLVSTTFPASKFADAALFRSFSFYYALGLYKKASEIKTKLESKYPNSKYLKKMNRQIFPTDEVVLVNTSPYKHKIKSNTLFTIQVGAFSSLQNAEKLKNRLLKAGYFSNIKPKVVNRKTLHIVTIGKFTEKNEAFTFLDVFKNKYNFSGKIIKAE